MRIEYLFIYLNNIKFNENLRIWIFSTWWKKGVANGKKGFSWKNMPKLPHYEGKKIARAKGNFQKKSTVLPDIKPNLAN
jgi:hypothetical protein